MIIRKLDAVSLGLSQYSIVNLRKNNFYKLKYKTDTKKLISLASQE